LGRKAEGLKLIKISKDCLAAESLIVLLKQEDNKIHQRIIAEKHKKHEADLA